MPRHAFALPGTSDDVCVRIAVLIQLETRCRGRAFTVEGAPFVFRVCLVWSLCAFYLGDISFQRSFLPLCLGRIVEGDWTSNGDYWLKFAILG